MTSIQSIWQKWIDGFRENPNTTFKLWSYLITLEHAQTHLEWLRSNRKIKDGKKQNKIKKKIQDVWAL